MKKVSIIIPVYNCAEYLKECFSSIESQSFGIENIEVIVVNDGSTDDSANIIEKYKNKHLDWKIITQENRGLSYSRNVGVQNATTQYVIFLDSDDYLDNEAVKRLYETITEKKVDVVIGKTYAFDSKGTYKYYTDKVLSKNKLVTYNTEKNILEVISIAGKIYNIELFKKYEFIEKIKHEDVYFSIKMALDGCSYFLINDKIYNRRYREGEIKSIMQSLNYSTYLDLIMSYKKIIEECDYDFYFAKYLARKINKYIARHLKKTEWKKAYIEYDAIINNLNKISTIKRILVKVYGTLWKDGMKIYGIIRGD